MRRLNGLKLARHIVRSEPDASVLMINLELCSLHLQETQDLEKVLSFLPFADGCAASLIRLRRSRICARQLQGGFDTRHARFDSVAHRRSWVRYGAIGQNSCGAEKVHARAREGA